MKEPLSARLNVRLTLDELERIEGEAAAHGISLSEYARARLTGRAIRQPGIARADADAVNELRRLGGLLKMLYASSGGANAAASAEVLAKLASAIDHLGGAR